MTSQLPTRPFGRSGQKVSAIGFGAMGLAAFYGTPSTQEQVNEVLLKAIEAGCIFWDTSDIYTSSGVLGDGEKQLGAFFKAHPGAREKVFLCTKFVYTITNGQRGLNGSRGYAKQACEASLRRLNTDHIDLYYAHRVDPKTPVEETAGALQELKDAGKVRYIGVSEYPLDLLERANEVAHIDAFQVELSPFSPEVSKNGLLQWCEKNGTALVAYSPLGRGFLTGQYKSPDDFEKGDFRLNHPRFTGENFKKNYDIVEQLKKLGDKKGCTAGQIALAWVLAQSEIVIPIPGTKKTKYLAENIDAGFIKLSPAELKEIDDIINSFKTSGERYIPGSQAHLAF